jgi:thiamine monophosphate kinase
MSRSGYTEDCDEQISWINWRGAVKSAIRGKRGQAFLYEMLQAMAALPERKLIAGELEKEGCVCAIGAVGKARGLDMSQLDPEDYTTVAGKFGIAEALAQEIVHLNDEIYHRESDEERFERMRRWIESNIFDGPAIPPSHGDTP